MLVLVAPMTQLGCVGVELLEAAISDFPGTLILVSHNAYLLERTTEQRLEL